MTNEEAIKELKEDRTLYESDIVEAGDGTPEGQLMLALDMAIEALEKQIPKKPKRIDKNYVFDGNWKKICPCCGITLMERITTKDESYPVHYNMTKHCKCGQTLDWSDYE